MPRPRFVFIHNRPVGAAEANVGAVLQMASALARAGAAVDLTAYEGGDAGDPIVRHGLDGGLRLHLQPERRGPVSYPALVLGALRHGGDVVYTRVPQIALYAIASGRRAILEMHTPIRALRRGERVRRALDLAAPRLAGLVAISPALDAELRAELPRFKGPRIVAPSAAIDLSPPHGAPPPDHDLGYVGGLSPGKGGDMVLDLAGRLPHARILLAGDAARHPEVEARAAALPNVTLLGVVPPAKIAATLARFRIGLAPYGARVTGAGSSGIDLAPWMSPLKLAEYASAGRAIVASDLPAVAAMVADGREAVLFPPGDLDAWTSGLQRLLARPEEVQRLGMAARAAWRQRFSWDSRARLILESCRL